MILNIKVNYMLICRTVLKEQLDALDVDYSIKSLGEIEFKKKPSEAQFLKLTEAFEKYGIELLEDSQNGLVQLIKEAIAHLLNNVEDVRKYNISTYLTEELKYSYSYLSTLFSEATHSSIENFIILKKIDLAKHMIIHKNLTLTEIAYSLNYSSVAHLSAQFKKTTGLTPSTFQRIIKKRKEREVMP